MRPAFTDTDKYKITDTPEVIYALMERCWDQDARLRPSFEDILSELNVLKTNQGALVRAGRGTKEIREMERLKREHIEEGRLNELEAESKKAQEKLRERMKRLAALREKRARAKAGEDTNDTDKGIKTTVNGDCNTNRLLEGQSQLGNNVEDINELRQRLKAQTEENSTLSKENCSLKEEITKILKKGHNN